MYALRARAEGGAGIPRGRWALLSGGLVLPRQLRKSARLAARLMSGEVEAPRYFMIALSAAVIASFSLYGAVVGGHMPSVVQAVTARTGFAINEIRVLGNHETSEIDIFDRVGLDGWTSLIGFDPDEARARIESLPWIETAAVRKVYPATLEVKVVERTPFAIWQQGSLLSLIEEGGRVIAPLSGSRHLALPLLVGAGAPAQATGFLAQVAKVPGLAPRVRGYVRVAERRWDLKLENGITVKLPEHGVDAALADLMALQEEQRLLGRDIETVDMRVPDRLFVKLSSEAATTRDAAMKKLLGKKYRPAERRI